jgi:hypothetical protein
VRKATTELLNNHKKTKHMATKTDVIKNHCKELHLSALADYLDIATYSHQTVPVILTHSVPISLKEMGEIDPHPNPN